MSVRIDRHRPFAAVTLWSLRGQRYWLTFQPGEIRTCTNCHGANTNDVFNNPPPTNPPEALTDLLEWYKSVRVPNDKNGWVVR